MQQAATLGKRVFGGGACNLRMVVVLAKVRQHHESCSSIIFVTEEIGEGIVGEMAKPGHDALLHRPRVRPDAQHFEVMIGFDHEHIAAANVLGDAGGHVSEIGDHTYFDAF